MIFTKNYDNMEEILVKYEYLIVMGKITIRKSKC